MGTGVVHSMENTRLAGSLIFVGAAQFLLLLVVSESLYPGYSVSSNYISDLGVGSTAPIFNTSVFLLGALVVVSSFFLYAGFKKRLLTATVLLTGIGAAGVGVFPETAGPIHGYFALLTFLFSGISAIASISVVRPATFKAYSAVLGAITLVCLTLYVGGQYYGLGRGGMERLIVYPAIAWALAFSGNLMGAPQHSQKP